MHLQIILFLSLISTVFSTLDGKPAYCYLGSDQSALYSKLLSEGAIEPIDRWLSEENWIEKKVQFRTYKQVVVSDNFITLGRYVDYPSGKDYVGTIIDLDVFKNILETPPKNTLVKINKPVIVILIIILTVTIIFLVFYPDTCRKLLSQINIKNQ